MQTLARFDVRCPFCKEEYHTDSTFVGRSIVCRCGASFVVEPPVVESQAQATAHRSRDIPAFVHTVAPAPIRHGFDWAVIYAVGCWITGILVFVGCWIYCVASYGFLLGVGLGWLPSLIVAVIAAYVWPLLAIILVVCVVVVVFVLSK